MYMQYPEERAFGAQIFDFFISLKIVRRELNTLKVSTVLNRSQDGLQLLKNFGRWARDCAFKHGMMTASRRVFDKRYNVDIFLSLRASRIFFHASALEWWYGYAFHRKFSVFFYFSHLIIAKVDLCEAIWRIAVCQLSVLVLFLLFSFIYYSPCSHSTVDLWICNSGLRGVLLPLSSQGLGLVDDQAFM